VVNEVATALGLTNVQAHHLRAEQVKGTFDFVISRAVTAMPVFVEWVKNKIKKGKASDGFSNGILYLKGGDLTEEFKGLPGKFKEYPLSNYFSEDFFETKKVIHWVS
jgi:16S rRNA (guanine527-N7)-methyltransferase